MHKLNELHRRDFLAQTAKACFGLTLGGHAANFFTPSALAATNSNPAAKAKNVIYLFMSGGMPHIDTFDPKPDAPSNIRGPVKAISTNVSGIQIGHCLPQVAKQMDKIALIRSMNTTQGAHQQGRYSMRTSYNISSHLVHPSVGSWVSSLAERQHKALPPFVTIETANDHPGAGFFEPDVAPLPIGNASEGLKNIHRLRGINEKQFNLQLKLRAQLDKDFNARFHANQKNVRAYDQVFEEAVKLMNSEDVKAFDLRKESADMHARYGEHEFAKGVLLARRLVEHGVRFVEVEFPGFDWHSDNFDSMEAKIPVLDQALATLLEDLDSKGLLDSTLVVLATEFGRSPVINNEAGRDHFPKAFSCLMAGGGIRGGQAIGETDKTASNVLSKTTSSADFNASIAHALGLDPNKAINTESQQPFRLSGRKGKMISELF